MNQAMLTDKIAPQMAAAMAKSRELTPGGRGDVSVDPIGQVRENYERERAYWNADGPSLPLVQDRKVPGPMGDIPVRLYYPIAERPLPVLVFFHGGGFVYGSLDSHDKICRLLARRSSCAVCAVDYRLAPEFKFPTPLREAATVVQWLRAEGRLLGLDGDNIALGGDSAGASISLGTALELKGQKRDWLRFLMLFYGGYGISPDSPSMVNYGGDEFGLPDRARKYFRGVYVPEDISQEDPRLALLKADLSALPPAFVGAAELDPLCDNSPALAERIKQFGGTAELHIYHGVLHGFLHLTRMVDIARQALDDAGDAVHTALYENTASEKSA